MSVNYNEPITFGRTGGAFGLNCTGVDFSEDAYSWTCASVAELDVQLPFARQDVVLQVEASPYLVPDLVFVQKVFLFLGGMFVGFCTFKGHGVRSFPVNRAVVSGRATRLSMVLPDATSPCDLQLSEDQRELGIYLTSITFRTVP